MDAIYLVRHCQASGQEPEAPLTELGVAQAEALAGTLAPLAIDRIVCSPFLRARQSIEPLARRLALPVDIDQRLCERALGSVGDRDWREALRATFLDAELCFAGGESSRTATNRAVAVLDELRKGNALRPVLITHGNLLSLLLRSLDHRFGFDEWAALTNPDVFRATFWNGVPIIERVWQR